MAIFVSIPSGGVLALADLDVSEMFEGTIVSALGTGDSYQLVADDAAIDHDNVEAVKDNGTLRWLKYEPGATGTPDPTPNAVPEALDDGTLAPGWLPPGLLPQTIYASPYGDDDNDGFTPQTAVEHGYVGYQKLRAVGGGRLRCASETEWGGPVPGQGCWIRGDGCEIDGWLQSVPSVIEMEGEIGANLFSLPGKGYLRGGSNDANTVGRTMPSIWLACNTRNIVQFRNIKPKVAIGHEGITGNYETLWGWRIGWDYVRKPSTGEIDWLDVTHGARSGTSTTLTVALTDADVTVVSATRTGTSVTLEIEPNGDKCSFPPWNNGTWIWFESTDPNFPSGAYQVTGGASLEVSDQWSFTYDDGETDKDDGTFADPGTVRTTQVIPGEFVDFENLTPVGFVPTQYRVTSVSIVDGDTATVVLYDPYGGHNGIPATVVTTPIDARIVHQERGFGQVLQPDIYNCANWMPLGPGDAPDDATYARWFSGPGFDFGTTTAIPVNLDSCAFQGYFPHTPSDNAYDENRMSACFFYGGAAGMAGFKMRNCTGNNASVRYIAGNLSSSIEIDLVSDTGDGYHPPAYSAYLSAYVDVNIVRADVADVFAGDPSPIITGSYEPSKIRGSNLPANVAGIMPVVGNGQVWSAGGYDTSPWAEGKSGIWTSELRIAGKHPAGNRQISPTMARFQNLVLPVDEWTNTHGSISLGHPDPMGGNGAVKLTADASVGNDMTVTLRSGVDADTTFEAGGRYIVAGWVNFPDADFNTARLIRWEGAGDIVWTTGTQDWDYRCPAAIAGWQFVVGVAAVQSASASQSYDVQVAGPPGGSGGEAYLFGFSALYVPAEFSSNDVGEFIGTLRAQPQYLPAGMAGTFEGQKFVAHGGIAGPSMDDVTLDGSPNGVVVPYYDRSGNLLGYMPLYDEAP